ncbi:MAG: metallophosphoesterase family protein [Bacilli bacterium]|nr:metallophosphoesterase family protein [Bacilli bacterium]
MRIAVFSDIHGNLQSLEAILSDIKNENIDKIICLGDVIGIGPNPKECLDLIIKNNIEMVLGNHELYYINGAEIDNEMEDSEKQHHKWVSEQLGDKYLQFLKNKSLDLKFNNILFEHFLIDKNRKGFYPFYDFSILTNGIVENNISTSECTKIIVGHEHEAFNILSNSKELIDIGSSGCTRDGFTSYVIVNIQQDIIIDKKLIKYDRETFIKNLKCIEYPEKYILSKIFFGVNL